MDYSLTKHVHRVKSCAQSLLRIFFIEFNNCICFILFKPELSPYIVWRAVCNLFKYFFFILLNNCICFILFTTKSKSRLRRTQKEQMEYLPSIHFSWEKNCTAASHKCMYLRFKEDEGHLEYVTIWKIFRRKWKRVISDLQRNNNSWYGCQ